MENNLQETYNKLLDLGDTVGETLTTEEQEGKKLTDEEIDLLSNTLNNVVEQNANLKVIADLPSNNGISEAESDLQGENGYVNVTINPATGEKAIVGLAEEDEDNESSELFEDIFDNKVDGASIKDIQFTDESVKDLIKDKFESSFTNNDVMQMVTLLNEYRKDNSIKVFNKLPKKIQQFINISIAKQGIPINAATNVRETVTKEVLDDLITDLTINNYEIEFNKEMDKLFGGMKEEMRNMSINVTKEQIKNLVKVEPEIREKNPEKADRLLLIIDNMKNSFSFEKLYNAIKDKKIGRIRKIDLEKPKKIYNKFNRLYEDSAYNIYDINIVPRVLRKVLPEDISDDKIHRFVISFCKYCENNNFKPDVLEEHSFMYYTVLNIVLLSLGTKSVEEDEYAKEITDNIVKVMSLFE